jgi:hypothetical protein
MYAAIATLTISHMKINGKIRFSSYTVSLLYAPVYVYVVWPDNFNEGELCVCGARWSRICDKKDIYSPFDLVVTDWGTSLFCCNCPFC